MLLFFTVAGNHGLLQLLQLSDEIERMALNNRSLKSDILELKNDIYAATVSDNFLERSAREELGLSKPGEIVYIFPDKSKARFSPTTPGNETTEATRKN